MASAFHGGGVGAGVEVRGGAGTRIRTGTTVMATPMAMVMATGTDTAMAMVKMAMAIIKMAMAIIKIAMVKIKMAMVSMARPANPELPNYSAGCNALVITTDRSTESWGHKPGAQSGHTNRTTAT